MRWTLIFLFSIFFIYSAFGLTPPSSSTLTAPNLTQTTNNTFDPVVANKQLDTLLQKYSRDTLTYPELEKSITTITALKNSAKDCVNTVTAEVSQISSSTPVAQPVATIPFTKNKNATTTSSNGYLQQKQQQLNQRLDSCRLLLVRATDANNLFGKTAEKMATTHLFHVEHSIVSILTHASDLFSEVNTQFDQNYFFERSGITSITAPVFSTAIFALVVFLLLAQWSRHWLKNLIEERSKEANKSITLFLIILRRFVFAVAFVSAFAVLSLSTVVQQQQWNELPYFCLLLAGLCAFLFLNKLLFTPPKPHQGLSHLPPFISERLGNRLQLLAPCLFVAGMIYLIVSDQDLPADFIHLLDTLAVTVFALILLSILKLTHLHPFLRYRYKSLRLLSIIFVHGGLTAVIIAVWLGYHHFAQYLVIGIAQTAVLLFLVFLIRKGVHVFLWGLINGHQRFQKAFRETLGIHPYQRVQELMWLQFFIDAVIWIVVAISALKIWGFATTYWLNALDYFANGFLLGKITINPLRILIAIFLFALGLFFTRYFRHRVELNPNVQSDPGSKESLATIATYAGTAVTLLIALLTAGVNFAGLAIIAGALSVGIGFGLQQIVGNFISGLILLIERPIRVGDRIMVGATEGYVSQISIRSTHIRTLARSDVVVPNMELITTQVTNFMLHDPNARFPITVGVNYDSDIDQVREILLRIAAAHSEVVQEGEDAPAVFLRTFAESAINFEMYVTVKNISERFRTISDLNFAVAREFRKYKIEIPYPQRQVWVHHAAEPSSNDKGFPPAVF